MRLLSAVRALVFDRIFRWFFIELGDISLSWDLSGIITLEISLMYDRAIRVLICSAAVTRYCFLLVPHLIKLHILPFCRRTQDIPFTEHV